MHLAFPKQRRAAYSLMAVAIVSCLGIALYGCKPARAFDDPPTQKADESAPESSPAGESTIQSGRAVGEYVPTFYTRVVTGPLMNRSICYVCRNGQRPVVMVFLRSLDPEFKPLLKQVDKLVDQHRADGLRSFGVFVSDDPGKAISPVQTFSFDNKIVLPLTVASETIAEPHCQNLNAEADVTVVLYKKRRVVRRFVFRADQIKQPRIDELTSSIHGLVKANPPGKSPTSAE